jgi:hypothetical protein
MYVAEELVPALTEPDNQLPEHMSVVDVGPSADGRCLVTVEDTRAPFDLDGHLIDPWFTCDRSGTITVDYGHSVDTCER